ncbi:hypothetical protein CHS0354_005782 [Potamilus streckersoni]|uniref:Uncharacterized protein n=1 Tax=Potamilus streckersoni TaxID=2493646 RepID=A0AAE0VZE7_9BIVA|nr:hypothetical protein CHS0354_005782 [Potamilus streckersoni]
MQLRKTIVRIPTEAQKKMEQVDDAELVRNGLLGIFLKSNKCVRKELRFIRKCYKRASFCLTVPEKDFVSSKIQKGTSFHTKLRERSSAKSSVVAGVELNIRSILYISRKQYIVFHPFSLKERDVFAVLFTKIRTNKTSPMGLLDEFRDVIW